MPTPIEVTGYINIEPDWDNLKRWFLNMKRTDLPQYRRVIAADSSGTTARWLGEQWPLRPLRAMKREQAYLRSRERGECR